MCGHGGDRWSPRTQAPCSACLREAGLYCLGRDMRPTTSLFLMLLVTAFLCLGSVASAAPQLTRNTMSLSDTFTAARCLVGPDGGDGQRGERVQAVPRAAHGDTRAGAHIFRYKTIIILAILKSSKFNKNSA